MAAPSDLIGHYSSLAFQTRLAALTFVGAAVGAEVVWEPGHVRAAVLGAALLIIVASLAELNRRYTWSYLSACRAAKRVGSAASPDEPWRDFVRMNEGPWSARTEVAEKPKEPKTGTQESSTAPHKELSRWQRFRRAVDRFFLLWSTYVPGLCAGVYLVMRDGIPWECFAACVVALALFSWWFRQSTHITDPEDYLPRRGAAREP